MARRRDRIFTGFFAGLFLLTSSALTIAVIYQAVHGNDTSTNSSQSDAQKAAENAQTQQANNNQKETKMENFTPTSQPQTKLQTIDIKQGTGATVEAGATITADYTGALMSNGTVFDASSQHGGPQTFSLSGVIAGWSQGIPGMKVGGTRRLLIPAELAYGSQSVSGIPANSDLVFDVTVTKIDK